MLFNIKSCRLRHEDLFGFKVVKRSGWKPFGKLKPQYIFHNNDIRLLTTKLHLTSRKSVTQLH